MLPGPTFGRINKYIILISHRVIFNWGALVFCYSFMFRAHVWNNGGQYDLEKIEVKRKRMRNPLFLELLKYVRFLKLLRCAKLLKNLRKGCCRKSG